MALRIPSCLADAVGRDGRDAWLAQLDGVVQDIARQWSLRIDDPFDPGGQTAWVAPATTSHGDDAVVKVAWRHPEAECEAMALRVWGGDGAVRLLDCMQLPDTTVLLLERCSPGDTLSTRPEPEQDEVIAGLLRTLWRALASDHFPTLHDMCQQWADGFHKKVVDRGTALAIDPALARDGIALFRSLPASAERKVLLCTDLHAGNILAAQREPWLAIDPKPHIGDPTYDAVQHMLNCPRRLEDDPIGLVERMANLLDLDAERLRLWLFARCVQESPGWPGLADVARRIAPD